MAFIFSTSSSWSFVAFLIITTSVSSFTTTPTFKGHVPSGASLLQMASSSSSSPAEAAERAIAPVDPSKVIILPDAKSVSSKIQSIVIEAGKKAVADRGHFTLAIPGGSILKMLAGMNPNDADFEMWAPYTTIVYVNHKCVSMDDTELATHAKARNIFLDGEGWSSAKVLVMDGTADGEAEAMSYEKKIRALMTKPNSDSESETETEAAQVLPVNENGIPVFDLALIGVGDDGHVGSLYPNRDEVLVGADAGVDIIPLVLPIDMKDPPSITLSLPVMSNAAEVVVAACGVSDKYPQGKSDGMRRAVADGTETLRSFPAAGLRGVATWVMDIPAASKLGDEYFSN